MTTLDEFLTSIAEDLAEHFLDRVQTIAIFEHDLNIAVIKTDPIDTPAILIEVEMGDVDMEADLGDGRMPFRLQFAAHCVLSNETVQTKRNSFLFASEVAKRVFYNVWGTEEVAQMPESITVTAGDFRRGKHGWESCVCSWEQIVHVGDTEWAQGGFIPTKVYMGTFPLVGTDPADYQQAHP